MKASRLYGKEIPYACTLLFLFLLAASLLNAQPVSQTFNSSGTYTVPVGYTANVTIQAWGGGGGGSSIAPGGGGGGGAFASISTTLGPGSYTVNVGTGGAPGNDGGSSSFTTIVIAAGGSSTTNGTGGAGGTTAASTGTTKIAGVNAANNSINNGGAGGAGGNGAGAGGTGGIANNGVGGVGISPAGGGGGKAGPGAGSGGSGAAGRVNVTVNSILPIKIGTIKAYEKQNGIQIDWTVYSEENVSHYQVERSANGTSFNAVGEVASRNSVAETKYGFFDSNPLQNVSFYRIKNIDLDGKSAYSNIVKINLDKSVKDITMYPNPVTANFFSLQSSDLAKGNYSVKVFAATGQELFSQKFTHNGGAINQTLVLPNGTRQGLYSLVLKNDATKVMSRTFIVQ